MKTTLRLAFLICLLLPAVAQGQDVFTAPSCKEAANKAQDFCDNHFYRSARDRAERTKLYPTGQCRIEAGSCKLGIDTCKPAMKLPPQPLTNCDGSAAANAAPVMGKQTQSTAGSGAQQAGGSPPDRPSCKPGDIEGPWVRGDGGRINITSMGMKNGGNALGTALPNWQPGWHKFTEIKLRNFCDYSAQCATLWRDDKGVRPEDENCILRYNPQARTLSVAPAGHGIYRRP